MPDSTTETVKTPMDWFGEEASSGLPLATVRADAERSLADLVAELSAVVRQSGKLTLETLGPVIALLQTENPSLIARHGRAAGLQVSAGFQCSELFTPVVNSTIDGVETRPGERPETPQLLSGEEQAVAQQEPDAGAAISSQPELGRRQLQSQAMVEPGHCVDDHKAKIGAASSICSPQHSQASAGETTPSMPSKATQSDTPLTIPEIIEASTRTLAVLKLKLSAVTAVARLDDGWRVTAELVERAGVPDTSDVLGVYELQLDRTGNVMTYERTRLRRRCDLSG